MATPDNQSMIISDIKMWFRYVFHLPAPARKRAYEAALALLGVFMVHGFITGDEAAAWAIFIGAVLTQARVNVSS